MQRLVYFFFNNLLYLQTNKPIRIQNYMKIIAVKVFQLKQLKRRNLK